MTSCILFQGGKDRYGYGVISVAGKKVRAHRLAWQQANGPIPVGLDVLHECDSPACINPAHLSVGTRTANNHDRDAKGRAAVGQRNGAAKLTADQVIAIRLRLGAGETIGAVARAYQVSRPTISDIRRGITWKHVGLYLGPVANGDAPQGSNPP